VHQPNEVPTEDLPELIAFASLRDDSPTPTSARPNDSKFSLELASSPTHLDDADQWARSPSTAEPVQIGDSGYLGPETRDLALLLGRRHAWFSPAALYAATVGLSSVLAYLHRPGKGWTVVVDPAGIEKIWLVEQIPDPGHNRRCRASPAQSPATPRLKGGRSGRSDRSLTRCDGERLVSFLVSYMFVYLRPSPATTGR
jgi:hypothetical protein